MVNANENEGHCMVPKSKEAYAEDSYGGLLDNAEMRAHIQALKG